MIDQMKEYQKHWKVCIGSNCRGIMYPSNDERTLYVCTKCGSVMERKVEQKEHPSSERPDPYHVLKQHDNGVGVKFGTFKKAMHCSDKVAREYLQYAVHCGYVARVESGRYKLMQMPKQEM